MINRLKNPLSLKQLLELIHQKRYNNLRHSIKNVALLIFSIVQKVKSKQHKPHKILPKNQALDFTRPSEIRFESNPKHSTIIPPSQNTK